LTSYMELLKENPKLTPRNAMPRWWIAYGQQPVERDAAGLAWRLSTPGIQVRTAAARLEADGELVSQGESDPLASQWAEAMTDHYDELAAVEPVFGQLRGCMDLALATAVVTAGDLLTTVGLELPVLLDETRLELAPHNVPKTVASHATALRQSRSWLVSVSGGVDLDVTHAVNAAGKQSELREARSQASPQAANSWWWD
jgi:hypothetical protein